MDKNDIVKLFLEIWELYGNSIEPYNTNKIIDNDLLIEEFFFVVLGGFGISYELNKSGLEVIKNKGFTERKFYYNNMENETTCLLKNEFFKKQFEPKTNKKEYRKYRFTNSKPSIIYSAGKWLLNEYNWNLVELLNEEVNIRSILCSCPGFGMKSASWLLRNTGYNVNYAVLDVHILRFVSKIGIEVPKILTEKAYIHIEEILRDICAKIDVSLGKMDYLLWLLGRTGFLDYVEVK